MEQQRALLAAALSLLILFLYQGVVLPWLYPPLQPDAALEQPVALDGSAPAAAPVRADEAAAQPAVPVLAAAPEKIVTVETDSFIAEISTRGARVVSFTPKGYRATVDPESSLQQLVVPTADGRRSIGIELRGAGADRQVVTIPDAEAPYVLTSTVSDLHLTEGQVAALDFTWTGTAGTIHKVFSFQGDRPDFQVAVRAEQLPAGYSEMAVTYVTGTKLDREVLFDRASYLHDKKLSEYHNGSSDLAAGLLVESAEQWTWTNLSGPYFIAAMIPTDPTGARLWLKQREHDFEQKVLFPITGGSIDRAFTVFLGAKRLETLDLIGSNLSRAVNLGWFDFVAFPLLWMLRQSHQFTANYGVDIIILTVLIKIAFLPLTRKSFQSMKAMQALQPQVNALRERLKDKPEQMNQEIMELYRRTGVNPLGGCLPMVVQIPVFIGLYQALSFAVELRHAPFALWINDLSAPDRLGSLAIPFIDPPGIPVLTLLMGGTMFVQQLMTPSTGDPQQRQMMMVMPLVFTFMFVSFPAGLSLYWTVSNILSVAQQYYINRSVK